MRHHHLWLLTSLLASAVAAQDPVLTELMARNATVHRDDAGANTDWFEIHNPRTTSIDLNGWFLTDDPNNLTKFKIDARGIGGGGYMVVYASGRNRRYANNPLHTNFTLDGEDGEYIALVKPGGTVVASSITFGKQRADVSFGRDPNTSGLVFFDTPTPGAKNGAGYPGLTRRPVPDVRRGFYDKPFSVGLVTTTQNPTIRYTTDGSRPTRTHGTVYTGRIGISRSTVLRAVAYSATTALSRVETHSYLYVRDALAQGKAPAGYPSNWGTHWTGSKNFTAVADYEMDQSIVKNPKWAAQMGDALRSLPSISIVMPIRDWFDLKDGIYSNPLKAGNKWERAASVEIITPRMGRESQINAGVQIMGRGSRRPWATPKHSLRVVFKERYGSSELETDLLGTGSAREHDTLALRSLFNDSYTSGTGTKATYLRDAFVRRLHRAGGRVDTHGAFAYVYINGLYWGLYHPSERPDADFQSRYFGGKPEDYDVLKHMNGVVVAGDKVAFDQAIKLCNGGLGSATAYAAFGKLVDVECLADYMALNFWAGTTDWPENNWYIARRRAPAGAFQFFNWDAEYSLNDVNIDRTGVRDWFSPGYFYARARANLEFRVLFGDRAHRLLYGDGPLVPATTAQLWRAEAAQIATAILTESARWSDVHWQPGITPDNWSNAVGWVEKTFVPQRHGKVVAQLQNAGLYPSTVAPRFSRYGGTVDPGLKLTMSAPKGQILYTLDGSDPRLVGGGVNSAAKSYSGALTINATTAVRARVRDGSSWSALTAARFSVCVVAINEVLAKNETGIKDNAGEREDWIELVNKSSAAFDASGLYLTDDRHAPTKWKIPANTTIPARGTVLFWADDDLNQGANHASFKLGAEGEEIWLFDRDGKTQLDGFVFGPQVADVSLGRLEDGRGPRVTFPEPTPNRSNRQPCRRVFSGRAHDLHPYDLDVTGAPRLGHAIQIHSSGHAAAAPVLFFWSRQPTYLQPLQPANDVALLVGAPIPLFLSANAQGTVNVPVWIAGDPRLVGLRFWFQTFGVAGGGIRGSNALELTICK